MALGLDHEVRGVEHLGHSWRTRESMNG
jgi:hypothetical protein